MALSSPGIGSNLDVNSIVQQLMSVEAQPLTTLAKKEASFQAKLSAFGSVKSALGAFQGALAGLSDPSKFETLTATPGDSTIVTASAASGAVAGSYNLDITQLAQAQTISSAAQASTTAAIGDGTTTTLTFQFGTISGGTLTNGVYTGATFTQDAEQSTGTVTIDSTNNSLQGIRDAINKAGIGVTATIVADGSATPNHLVLTSNKTGETSSMKITVDGHADLSNLLAYDPAGTQNMTQGSAAQSAAMTVNGIAISSSTNTVSEAVQGVTLNLAKVGTTTLAVARNTASVTSAVNGFVTAYNELNKTLKNLTAYDPATRVGGTLIGDATVRTIEIGIRKTLTTSIPELSGSLKTLSDVGISFQKDGTLKADSTKLENAIANNFSDVGALFAAMGTPTDSLVNFVSSTSATKAGEYAVNITTLATQGTQTGNAAPAAVIDADTTLNVTLDGTSATVALTAGTYTSTQLASMMQSAINGTSAFSALASSVKVTVNGSGFLNLASARYGSASNVSIASVTGTTAADLMGASPTSTAGVDVAGTIGGIAATGSGQNLTGATGYDTEGLKLLITGSTTGDRGTVRFSQGYAYLLDELVDTYLESSGLISSRTKGIDSSIEDIGRARDALNARLIQTEKRYRAQFLALDKVISSMSQTSTFLQQQLSNLPKITSE